MTKIKNRFINNAECLMPSVFTQSNIFLVIAENDTDRKKELVSMSYGSRKKTEAYSYSGYKLDLVKDYPLFHIFLREKQKQGTNEIKINLNDVMKELGMAVRSKNRNKLYERIWDFGQCSISVMNIEDDKEADKYKLPEERAVLINRMSVLDKKHVIVHFCKEMDIIVNSFDTQVIDLAEYRKLKMQSAMAIYLSIKSHGFIKSKIINLTLKVLRVHYEDERNDGQVKEELKEGFKKLISLGIIKSYEKSETHSKATIYKIKLE
jgi:hypothetical protein